MIIWYGEHSKASWGNISTRTSGVRDICLMFLLKEAKRGYMACKFRCKNSMIMSIDMVKRIVVIDGLSFDIFHLLGSCCRDHPLCAAVLLSP